MLRCVLLRAHGTIRTCYLIGNMQGTNATIPSNNREIGFMPANRPMPQATNFSLSPANHLWPLVDMAADLRSFDKVPDGFYIGSGASSLISSNYVYYDNNDDGTIAAAASAVGTNISTAAKRAGDGAASCATRVPLTDYVPIRVENTAQVLNFAPVLENAKVVLLGEVAKFAAISTYRYVFYV